jgi:hypothetical protein
MRCVVKVRLTVLVGAAITSFLLVSETQANIVTNGDFASCTLHVCTGWTFTAAASGSEFGYNNGEIFDMTSYAAFGAIAGLNDEISQSISTIVGDNYTISFNAEIRNLAGSSSQELAAEFGANTLLDLLNNGPMAQTAFSFTVEASQTSTLFAFLGSNGPSWTGLTSVSVVDDGPAVAATPLPAALPLFASGLGAMGFFGWRRKRKLPIAA